MPSPNKIQANNLTRRGAGRPKGSANKTPTLLKEALIIAAEQVGEDGKGKGKLAGYCKYLAVHEPKAFAGLLGRVLPLQVTGADGGPVVVEITRFADRAA